MIIPLKKPQETKQLLHQALGLDSKAQTMLLDQVTDQTLKSQVVTLLLDAQQRQQFLAQFPASPDLPASTLTPGSMVNRIRIEKLLGQGGMGSVYLGFDEKLERQVAIKSIRPEHLKNPATQQRFVREAQILSKINHPFICQLYDYMETDQGDFLVLEYIKGKPLYQVPMTHSQKLKAMSDLASALVVAHEHGIVHRDLKPDNIMITDQGQLKVLDFGIAQSLAQPSQAPKSKGKSVGSGLTQQGSLVGTIRYMSPEQAQGQVIDIASDMYAFGVIVQEVFSHQAAYQIQDTEQLLADVQQGKRISAAGLPEGLSRLINDLTQTNPGARPTAAAAEARIQNLITAPKRRKQRLVKSALMVIGLGLVVVLLWQWLQLGQQARHSEQVKSYEQQINQLVKQAEQIYVLPIHPVDQEIAQVLQQGEQLFAAIQVDDSLSDVAKKRLQGIILLEGESFQQAIMFLEQGEAEASLLARAWIGLYIEKASAFSDQHGFEKTMQDQELREKYLQPALQFIEKTASQTGEIDPLYDAFKLSQTVSFQAGLTAVNGILENESWNKEAVKLKALILFALNAEARERGAWEAARDYSEMTIETYQLSTEMARSYPPDYVSLCWQNYTLMADGILRTGDEIAKYTGAAVTACRNALITQPNHAYAMNVLAGVYLMQANWQLSLGEPADAALKAATELNQQAAALSPSYQTTWNQALINTIKGQQLMQQGGAALPPLQAAIDTFSALLKVDSEYKPYVTGDMLYTTAQFATEQIKQGVDHHPTLQLAQHLYDEAVLTPDLMVLEQRGLVINMAVMYWVDLLYNYINGTDITAQATQLLAFLNPSDGRLNNEPNQLVLMANVHLLLVKYQHGQQLETDSHLDMAQAFAEQALAINHNNIQALIALGSINAWQALRPGTDFTTAQAWFDQAAEHHPNNPYLHHAQAESYMLQAQASNDQQNTTKALELARTQINRALAIDANNPLFNHLVERLENLPR